MGNKIKLFVFSFCLVILTISATSLIFIYFYAGQKNAVAPSTININTQSVKPFVAKNETTATSTDNNTKNQKIADYLKIAYGLNDYCVGHFGNWPAIEHGVVNAHFKNYQTEEVTKTEANKEDADCPVDNTYMVISERSGKTLDKILFNTDLAAYLYASSTNGCGGSPGSTSLTPLAEAGNNLYFSQFNCWEGCGFGVMQYNVKTKKEDIVSLEDIAKKFNTNSGNINLYNSYERPFINYTEGKIYVLAGESEKNQIQIIDFAQEKIYAIETDWKFGEVSTSTECGVDSAIFLNPASRGLVYVIPFFDDNNKNKTFSIDQQKNNSYTLTEANDLEISQLTIDDLK